MSNRQIASILLPDTDTDTDTDTDSDFGTAMPVSLTIANVLISISNAIFMRFGINAVDQWRNDQAAMPGPIPEQGLCLVSRSTRIPGKPEPLKQELASVGGVSLARPAAGF